MLCFLLRVHTEVSPAIKGSKIKMTQLPILEGFFFFQLQSESTGEQGTWPSNAGSSRDSLPAVTVGACRT